ncbi:hypothetical protein HDR63_01480 [bacterium]|nr:hypothetical protein [bacterium]
MKKTTLFLLIGLWAPVGAWAATPCSQTTLRRCLDSVCAINIGANPAARCQYCGRASAGGVPKNTTMKNVTTGAKGALSDKELKNAPTSDPGQRYIWATAECIKKVAGCTPDDVTEMYDPLIKTSCDAAGLSEEITQTLSQNHQTKSQDACSNEIMLCMMGDERCGADLTGCETDADFDAAFAACSVAATGCTEYATVVRGDILTERDQAIASVQRVLDDTIVAYQSNRVNKMADAQKMCTNNAGRESCIAARCAQNMPNKCAAGFESERAAATLLCKFYDIACDRLKK